MLVDGGFAEGSSRILGSLPRGDGPRFSTDSAKEAPCSLASMASSSARVELEAARSFLYPSSASVSQERPPASSTCSNGDVKYLGKEVNKMLIICCTIIGSGGALKKTPE